ncbi:MAG: succinic semialdehyde dehydrogenase [Actinomycetota bacterium]|nr:succinic semialdehyde dehydrogenase [Actinomycetota bacterium]
MTVRDQQVTPRVGAALLREFESRIDVPTTGREMIDVDSPFNLDVIGRIPQATPEDVVAAVDRARQAQPAWAAIGVKRRAAILLAFHDLLLNDVDTVVDVIQVEGGKVRAGAWEEVIDVAGTARYYANTAPELMRRRRRQGAMPLFTKTHEYRHPKGVCGFISPWNFPFNLSIGDALAALVAGNSVVIKPDEKTPFSLLAAVQLLDRAEVPGGVIQVVTGRGEICGPALIDAVDYVMFTGSSSVGSKVAEQAGRNLIGASMELGGKNAAIVLADADLRRTIPELARGTFGHAGQMCVHTERIYVERPILEDFTRRFVEHTENLEVSSSFEFGPLVSSLITRRHLEAVESHVEDALAKGANLLTGGKPRPDVGPLFYAPTILTDVDETMAMCRGETFGPVVAIYPVSSADEAVRLSNDSDLGLHFSIWSSDTRRAEAIATRLQAGSVAVNDGYVATWGSHDAPMGGFKGSGLGRRHGREGLLKFTDPQTVAVQRLIPAYAPALGLSYETYRRLVERLVALFRRLPFYK